MDEKTLPTYNSHQNRMLDVQYHTWREYITVIDPSTQQVVYKLQGSHGRFDIFDAEGQLIGATKTSSLSSKIEVEMPGQAAFQVKNDKLLGMVGSPRYDSPAFGGQTMTWKNTAMSKNIIYTLIEGKGMALARFESNWKLQTGKLEIVDPSLDSTKMNEVMVLLLTLLRRKLKQIQDATVAAIAS